MGWHSQGGGNVLFAKFCLELVTLVASAPIPAGSPRHSLGTQVLFHFTPPILLVRVAVSTWPVLLLLQVPEECTMRTLKTCDQ